MPNKTMEEKPEFYTVEQVAKILQITPETIRRYVRNGKLKAIKLGGKFIRVGKKDLDDFIVSMQTV